MRELKTNYIISRKKNKKIMNKILYWTPRILMILFIGFISLFALDAFTGDSSYFEKLGAFLIHLIPTGVLVFLLIVAWRYEWVGAVAFSLLAIGYIIMAWAKFPVGVYFLISGPLFVISILFGVNCFYRRL